MKRGWRDGVDGVDGQDGLDELDGMDGMDGMNGMNGWNGWRMHGNGCMEWMDAWGTAGPAYRSHQ